MASAVGPFSRPRAKCVTGVDKNVECVYIPHMEVDMQLQRKQYMLGHEHLEIIRRAAEREQCSASGVVRRSVEAYAAHPVADAQQLDALLALVNAKLDQALVSVDAANVAMEQALGRLDAPGVE